MRPIKILFAERFLLRFHMLLILGGSVAASTVCNRYLLRHGIDSMFLRYPLNVVAAYGAFFLFIRLWLSYIHLRCQEEVEDLDFISFDERKSSVNQKSSWLEHLDTIDPGISDDCGCAIIVLLLTSIVFLAGGVLFIMEAPVLLTEIAASFFLAGSLSRPARSIVEPGWSGSIVRQTWKRFMLALLISLVLALGAHIACPQSHTIPEALRNCL